MTDAERAAKLEEAIGVGFIDRYAGADGILTYVLTPTGLIQWLHEIQRSRGA